MLQSKVTIPDNVKKYFWGDDLEELNWQDHQQYIVQTIMEHGDFPEIRWLFSQVSKTELLEMLPKLTLSKKSSNFWSIYLS